MKHACSSLGNNITYNKLRWMSGSLQATEHVNDSLCGPSAPEFTLYTTHPPHRRHKKRACRGESASPSGADPDSSSENWPTLVTLRRHNGGRHFYFRRYRRAGCGGPCVWGGGASTPLGDKGRGQRHEVTSERCPSTHGVTPCDGQLR